jgi:molybdopterin-containing oxidoreductase family membrane subunit
MWLERYIIVISSASYPRSETMWDGGVYTPSLVEISLTAAEFAAFVLLFIVFAKLFPIVSIWEIKEGDERDIDAVTDILERESPGGAVRRPD